MRFIVILPAFFAVFAALPAGAATVDVETYVAGFYGNPIDSDQDHSDSNSPPFHSTAYASSSGPSGASVWALADLASGALKGVADSTGTDNRASFSAAMSDGFVFNIANATADTITRLFLKVHYDAEIYRGGTVQLATEMRTGVGQYGSTVMLANPGTFTFYHQDAIGVGYDNIEFSDLGNSTIHGTFNHLLAFDIKGATGTASFFAGVSTVGDGGGKANFGNSAHFSFILPKDVTFTSGSGVSFTAVGGVPEPSTWAMMLVGFGTIGAAMRRRRNIAISFA
jgi:hypothetical protein